MKLAIGSDHVGFELKPVIIEYLEELGCQGSQKNVGFGPLKM